MFKYIIIIIIFIVLLWYINNNIYSTKYEIASLDKKQYLVRNEPDSKKAANLYDWETNKNQDEFRKVYQMTKTKRMITEED